MYYLNNMITIIVKNNVKIFQRSMSKLPGLNSDYAHSAWFKHLIELNKRLRGLMNLSATVTEAVSSGRSVIV